MVKNHYNPNLGNNSPWVSHFRSLTSKATIALILDHPSKEVCIENSLVRQRQSPSGTNHYLVYRPLCRVGGAESAGRLRSALVSPGVGVGPRPFPQPLTWPQPSGMTIESAEIHVRGPPQPRLTPLFLSGGPEPGKAHPHWPRPSGIEVPGHPVTIPRKPRYPDSRC